MYAGSLIIACLFIFAVNVDSKNQKLKTEYVNNPLIGDVYQIGQDEKYGKTFYFVKIKNINSDTIEFLHWALQYNSIVSEMSDADYFVKDDVWRLLKKDVINFLDSGYIYSVDREYELDSRFNIEQY